MWYNPIQKDEKIIHTTSRTTLTNKRLYFVSGNGETASQVIMNIEDITSTEIKRIKPKASVAVMFISLITAVLFLIATMFCVGNMEDDIINLSLNLAAIVFGIFTFIACAIFITNAILLSTSKDVLIINSYGSSFNIEVPSSDFNKARALVNLIFQQKSSVK